MSKFSTRDKLCIKPRQLYGKIIIVILILLFSINHFLINAQSNPCGDFYRFACSDNNQGRNDGTGNVRETEQLQRQLNSIIQTEVNSNFNQPFDQLLARDLNLQETIAASVGCSRDFIDSCSDYPKAIEQIKQYALTINTGAYSQETEPSESVISFMRFSALQTDPRVATLLQNTERNIEQRLVPLQRRNQIQDTLFPQIRASIAKVIQRLPDSPQRQQILQRLNQTTLSLQHCDGRENILEPNARYNTSTKQIELCFSDLFRSNSLFSVIGTLAHEIAHSFDPDSDLGTQSLFSGLTQCLSHSRNFGIPAGHAAMDEAFCDWMSTEVIADFTQTTGHPLNRSAEQLSLGLANRFPYCEFASGLPTRSLDRSHPLGRDRINNMMAHPVLRQRMGCTNSPQQSYCSINGLPPGAQAPPAINLERNGVAQ